MAVKTITIDLEAYDTLSEHKRGAQSFSQVIKTHFGPRPTAGRFRHMVRTLKVNADALDRMDAQVSDRKRHPARAVVR